MNNKVCCVVVTFNIGNDFYKCFNSVINQVDKVFIVDNGSNQETINVLNDLEKNSKVEIMYNNNNLGIAAALNKGIDYAIKNDYSWVLTMDNDSEATPNMVEVMLAWYNQYFDNESVIIIFPDYIEKISIENPKACISQFGDYKCKEIYFDNTSGNLVKVDVFKEIGKFKEELFIDSVDHDFCLRVKRNGGKMVKVLNAKLLHSLGNTKVINFLGKKINCSNHSPLRRYYITRNRCLMRKIYRDEREYIDYDRKTFINENIKILLFEKDKINKIRMSLKGYIDYKNNIFGPISNCRREKG